MRASLRGFYSSDVDLAAWRPDDGENFSIGVTAFVRPSDSGGEEMFDFHVCTARWGRAPAGEELRLRPEYDPDAAVGLPDAPTRAGRSLPSHCGSGLERGRSTALTLRALGVRGLPRIDGSGVGGRAYARKSGTRIEKRGPLLAVRFPPSSLRQCLSH